MQNVLTLESNKYAIKIENFEGPLDLLCHLIDKNKMDIYDIRISEIADQYIEYINAMEEANLEVTSEFLVMASTLLLIKSKGLLPTTVENEEELTEEQLIERIIEYKKYKEITKKFRENYLEFSKRFFKFAEIIELPNISNPDEILKIELDPRKNPSENAQDYFEKFKKSKRGIPILEERLQQTEEHEEYLNSYIDVISETENIDELKEIEDKLKHGKPISKKSFVQISSPRKYNFMNFTIISGKNPEQNDEVSLKIASKNDMWFHARGMGGSHVIIKSDKNEKPPKEVIVRAAEIAAYHSKGKNSSKVQVIQTFARHVQKKKGMAPGAVRVAKENSITVNPTNYDFLEWLKKQNV